MQNLFLLKIKQDDLNYQIDSVKYLHFSNLVAAWVGQKAVVIVD